jgi:ankyrin repeat protein
MKPIHFACEEGFTAVVRLLLVAGANIEEAHVTVRSSPYLYPSPSPSLCVSQLLVAATNSSSLCL